MVALPSKLRFENQKRRKIKKQALNAFRD